MIIADKISDYKVLDTGDGMKLESWGGYLLARPDPQVIWKKSRPALWEKAHAVYHRSATGGGHWEYKKQLPERWEIGYGGLRFYVRPTGFKHTGLFPEQSANWQFMMDALSGGEEVLNLFAYTGGATLAAAKAGARLTHVDAAKSMVAWAKENDITGGTTPTTFSPQGQVTLGEALKLVLMSAGYGDQIPTGSHWASGFYQLAQENGFLPSGLSLGLNDPINRLQIAEIIVNVLDLSRTSHDPSPFADTEDLSALILYDHGIFQGNQVNGELLFQPQDHITRAEITTVIWRVYELKNQTPEEPEEPDNPPDLPEEPEEPEEPTGDYFYFGGKKVYVVEEMPKRTYDSSLFQVNENGFLTYDSDKYTSKIGIDVSRYQGSIDWAAVKDAGVEFAMLRLGYRGYGTGAIVRDSYFYQNIQGALENGIEVGVYFFSQAINEAEAVEEAQFCMDLLQDYSITYPIVFDWEPYDSSLHPRTEGLSDEMLTKCAVAFCQAVEANGYDSMVYSNLTYFYLHYDLSKLVDFPLWLAQYNKTPTFYYHFDMWQYSSTGKVPGIEGNVDLNIQMIPKT